MPGSSVGAERQGRAGAEPRGGALVITGPTASGKSALALALAAKCPAPSAPGTAVEIVSMDSALVYRGLDIGTAKPSVAERAAVPHHLIDILDPTEAYSAARFVADARRLIGEISARGHVALVVGGTPLYLHALQHGLDELPTADAALRAQIEADAAARGWPALHAELMQLDPTTAARLAPNDAQRIQRALEVVRLSGRPLAALQHGPRPLRADALPVLSLEPQDRAWLHARIAQRFDQMLAAGLLAEVRALQQRPELSPNMPALRCVGYRQAWAALAGGGTEATIMATVRERGVAATRQLAKRQLTWLRGMVRETVNCDAADAPARALAAACRLLGMGQT